MKRRKENESRLALFLAAGFFAGILSANLQPGLYIADMGIFSGYFLEQYAAAEIRMPDYLWYVARVRAVPLLFAGAAGCTRFKKAAAAVFLLWTGFCGGLLFAAAVMKLGIRGILLCLLAMVPHFAFYAMACFVLLWYLYNYPEIRWDLSKTAFFLLSAAVGVLLECYVNPVLMQFFVRAL